MASIMLKFPSWSPEVKYNFYKNYDEKKQAEN
jgi:hypothetical protein